MTTTLRFAPSPTGQLHIGNARTAILNWLYAKKKNGTFILRLDDTDRERSSDEFARSIREDLEWMGIKWDYEAKQSDRFERYETVAGALKKAGWLYPCYETEDELAAKRRRQLAEGRPPIYDRASLALTPEQRAAFEAGGRKPYWRFRLINTEAGRGLKTAPTMVSWNDMVRGDQMVDIGSVSDPVVIRADGTPLYTFTSVVDDIDMRITHVIRGQDHITNTGVQIAVFEALGRQPPVFGHHNLLVDAEGKALSKRDGALSLSAMRDAGLEPMAVASHGALIGTSDAIEPHLNYETLAGLFDPLKISQAPARFDIAELKGLNARLLHATPYTAVAPRLEALSITGGEPFWLAVRANLERLEDARTWWQVVSAEISPVIENAELTRSAAGLLPPEPWDQSTWNTWTKAVKEATGAKGRALFHPLRLALTGCETGPELKVLLPLIGRDRATARLTASAS